MTRSKARREMKRRRDSSVSRVSSVSLARIKLTVLNCLDPKVKAVSIRK